MSRRSWNTVNINAVRPRSGIPQINAFRTQDRCRETRKASLCTAFSDWIAFRFSGHNYYLTDYILTCVNGIMWSFNFYCGTSTDFLLLLTSVDLFHLSTTFSCQTLQYLQTLEAGFGGHVYILKVKLGQDTSLLMIRLPWPDNILVCTDCYLITWIFFL